MGTKKAAAKKKEPKAKAPRATKAPARRKKKAAGEPGSRGVEASEVGAGAPPEAVAALARAVEADGGQTLATYRDPLGGHWQLLASLPIGKVAPTPFQRDLSETHAARLGDVLDRLDRFLDPIITVRNDDGTYWTPNGNHRLAAMTRLGARAIVALVVPERQVAFRILALNTEKAHNLREKALEVIRMARSLGELDRRPETDYALELEEPSFVTLGLAYEARPRLSGSVYHPILKRLEAFLPAPVAEALEVRRARVAKLLELDDRVAEAVAALKEHGLTSPYLKNFVVARVNPIRFAKGDALPSLDEVLEKMIASAAKFDATKVRADQVASTGGPPPEEG